MHIHGQGVGLRAVAHLVGSHHLVNRIGGDISQGEMVANAVRNKGSGITAHAKPFPSIASFRIIIRGIGRKGQSFTRAYILCGNRLQGDIRIVHTQINRSGSV